MWIVYSKEEIDGTGHKKVGKIMTEEQKLLFFLSPQHGSSVLTSLQEKEPLPKKKPTKKLTGLLVIFSESHQRATNSNHYLFTPLS